jgi:putative oxidoreductase
MQWLRKLETPAYVALRIVLGFMFTCHGLGKIFGVLAAGAGPKPFTQMWIGGVIELAGGALVGAGLFTRVAAFICSGQMAVAYFQFHVGGHFEKWHWLPIVNHGELAVVYCFAFLLIAARGPGPLSIDRAMHRA